MASAGELLESLHLKTLVKVSACAQLHRLRSLSVALQEHHAKSVSQVLLSDVDAGAQKNLFATVGHTQVRTAPCPPVASLTSSRRLCMTTSTLESSSPSSSSSRTCRPSTRPEGCAARSLLCSATHASPAREQELTACCWLSTAGQTAEKHGDVQLAVGGNDNCVTVISLAACAAVRLLKGHSQASSTRNICTSGGHELSRRYRQSSTWRVFRAGKWRALFCLRPAHARPPGRACSPQPRRTARYSPRASKGLPRPLSCSVAGSAVGRADWGVHSRARRAERR